MQPSVHDCTIWMFPKTILKQRIMIKQPEYPILARALEYWLTEILSLKVECSYLCNSLQVVMDVLKLR